jgi:alkyl hydroperoxide reductase subunit AhpF
MEQLAKMIGPVTLRFAAEDLAAAALVAELSTEQPLVQAETTQAPEREGPGATLELRDSWGRATGIRFQGLPAGQERGALLDALVMVSRGSTPLSPLARAQARDLSGELWVLVTPT